MSAMSQRAGRFGAWRGRAVACAVLFCCLAAAAVFAPPARGMQPGENNPPAAAKPTPESKEDARANALRRLDNRLEWTRRMARKFGEAEQRMLDAKRRIEAGEDPEPIMQALRREDSPNLRIRISRDDDGRDRDGPGDEPMRWRDHRHGGDPDHFPPATPEQKYRVDQMLDTVIPDLSHRLKAICETQPERCEQEYARLAYRMHHIIQDGIADQALFDLRLDDMRVSARVVQAARRVASLREREGRITAAGETVSDNLAAELTEARQSLETLIGEQFDIRSRIREEERAKLQRERDRIQQQIQQIDDAVLRHGNDRDRIIQEQVAEAVEQARQGRERPAEGMLEQPKPN